MDWLLCSIDTLDLSCVWCLTHVITFHYHYYQYRYGTTVFVSMLVLYRSAMSMIICWLSHPMLLVSIFIATSCLAILLIYIVKVPSSFLLYCGCSWLIWIWSILSYINFYHVMTHEKKYAITKVTVTTITDHCWYRIHKLIFYWFSFILRHCYVSWEGSNPIN
jgi:hypothetical protein